VRFPSPNGVHTAVLTAVRGRSSAVSARVAWRRCVNRTRSMKPYRTLRPLRRALLTAAFGLFALSSAHAQFIISSLSDSPDPVPAGGTVTYSVRVAETNGSPLTGASFAFSVPAGGVYMGTGTLPAGASCSGMGLGQPGP